MARRGKKSKPFIEKKNASTYHLMHRSQRDVADDLMLVDEGELPISSTGMVLWPGDNNLPETNRKVMMMMSSTPANAHSSTMNDEEQPDTVSQQHTSLKEWRSQLEDAGLLDTDEPADKYLKPITGTGTFLDARSGKALDLKKVKNIQPESSYQQKLSNNTNMGDDFNQDDALMEVDRAFDSIPLTADCMDPDIAAALFGDIDMENGEYEELNDDFVFMAAQEPTADNTTATTIESFDYDEHIRRLLEKAKRNPTSNAVPTDHNVGQRDVEFFSQLKPLGERNEDDDADSWDNEEYDDDEHNQQQNGATPGNAFIVPKLNPEEERVLCEKFEMTLAEYDESDDDDDYDEEEKDDEDDDKYDVDNKYEFLKYAVTNRPLEGDAYVEAALDEYLQEKNDDVYIQGIPRDTSKNGGSSFTAYIDKKLIRGTEWKPDDHATNTNYIKDCDDEQNHKESVPSVDIILAEAQIRLAEPHVRPPAEDVFFDGKSYYSERQRNPWDCESVLTTYSNLENNPTTIDVRSSAGRRRRNTATRRVQQNDNEKEDEPLAAQPILLSSKTGLPISAYESNRNNKTCYMDNQSQTSTIHSLYKREKNETPEEKKARKFLIKQDKTMSRIQKKVSKEIYSDEFQKKRSVPAEDIAGKTVYRLS